MLAVCLSAPANAATPGAADFYSGLLRRGVAAFDAGRDDDAVRQLRIAAFGFVDSLDLYQTAQTYLALAHSRAGEESAARAAAAKVVAAQRQTRRFTVLQIPTTIRSAFLALAQRLLPPSDVAALQLPPQGGTAETASRPAAAAPVTQPPPAAQPRPAEPLPATPAEPSQTPAATVPAQPVPITRPAPAPTPVDTPKQTAPAAPATEAPTSQPASTPTETPRTITTEIVFEPSKAAAATPAQQTPAATTAPAKASPPPQVVEPPPPPPPPAPAAVRLSDSEAAQRLAAAERALNEARLPQARSIYRELLAQQSLSRPHLLRLAEGLYRSRDFRHALDAFRLLGTLQRGEEPYRYYIAVALYETGDYALAKEELRAALPFIEVTPDVARYQAKIQGAL